MNLTDFEQTPMHVVFEAVRREAERHGVPVVGSEIVGLVPRKALEMSAEYFLRFENFRPELVLENRIADAMASRGGHDGGPRQWISGDGFRPQPRLSLDLRPHELRRIHQSEVPELQRTPDIRGDRLVRLVQHQAARPRSRIRAVRPEEEIELR